MAMAVTVAEPRSLGRRCIETAVGCREVFHDGPPPRFKGLSGLVADHCVVVLIADVEMNLCPRRLVHSLMGIRNRDSQADEPCRISTETIQPPLPSNELGGAE